MFRQIASVGSFTLISRVTGFARDIVIAALLGAGVAADAFVVAQRLPNHFRAILGEGAFNAAFVPTYSRTLERDGAEAARAFASGIMVLLGLVLLAINAAALVFMPHLIALLAPGFSADPAKFHLAVTLTRITFPYLFFISLVTLVSGVLNAHQRFAAAAAAPVLLNLSVIAALALAFLFPDAAYAAAWGVMISGILQWLLVVWDARQAGVMPGLARPRWSEDARSFFKALGPAVVGSAGVQIAMFADTVLASLLPTGGVASLYYADRLYQLPVGMIGIAAGTVLLPTMSRHLAAERVDLAFHAQNRAMAFTLALSMPFTVAFLLVPDLIMRGLFMRGAFDASDAARSGAVLAAYAVGLPAVVLIRSAVASFYARSDTTTPVIASFTGIACNVGLKLLLAPSLGAAGLALATSAGAWINIGLLAFFALRRDHMRFDRYFIRMAIAVGAAALGLAGATILLSPIVAHWAEALPVWRQEIELAILATIGLVLYATLLLAGTRGLGLRLRRD
jgi:putative peptidoglycan lipid II flippase